MDFNPNFQFDLDAVFASVTALMTPGVTTAALTGALVTLGEQCYGASAKSGWWHDLSTGKQLDRDKGIMIALVHSEISEGLEGVRKGLNDDHLSHRPMIEVELADTLIRMADFWGGFDFPVPLAYAVVCVDATDNAHKDMSVGKRLAILHTLVSFTFCGVLKLDENSADPDNRREALEAISMSLAGAVAELVSICIDQGYDLAGAVAEKMAYNANRADHKAANRAAAGGKAF